MIFEYFTTNHKIIFLNMIVFSFDYRFYKKIEYVFYSSTIKYNKHSKKIIQTVNTPTKSYKFIIYNCDFNPN